MQVRAATEGDTPFLVRLAGEAYRDLVTRQFGAWDEGVQAARFAAKVERLPFKVGEVAGQRVAAVSSSVHADHVFLNEILVLPEFQNCGLGSELLEREIRGARQLGLPLRLHTLRLNPAVRLFERHGFVVTARGDVFLDWNMLANKRIKLARQGVAARWSRGARSLCAVRSAERS